MPRNWFARRPVAAAGVPGLRRTLRRPLVLLVVIAVGVGLYRSAHQAKAPKLTASCRAPVLALSTKAVVKDGIVLWSATGPPGRYLLAVDAVGASVVSHSVRLVPPPGSTPAQLEVASLPVTFSHCGASGRFSVVVAPGQHQVRLFALGRPGVPVVASAPITVTR